MYNTERDVEIRRVERAGKTKKNANNSLGGREANTARYVKGEFLFVFRGEAGRVGNEERRS